MSISKTVKQKAVDLGFDLVGITTAEPLDAAEAEGFSQWLAGGNAAGMAYMHRNLDKRLDPAGLLDGARSVVVVGLAFKPPVSEEPRNAGKRAGRVAHYARYEDYHGFIKDRLRKLADLITERGGEHRFKVCVDSAPVCERALAARAGLGFIGRNHMLINPELGPEVLLGELLTTIELQQDKPVQGCCEGCDKCIKACPTGALGPDGSFDAGKCISYLTIEHKGEIEQSLIQKVGDRVFGCDECVLVCPYYQRATECRKKQFKYYPDRARLDLSRCLSFTEESFIAEFADSPIRRLGLSGLKRNAKICFG